jgi:hypothetical protein
MGDAQHAQRPRFSLRALFVATTIAAIGLAGWRLLPQWQEWMGRKIAWVPLCGAAILASGWWHWADTARGRTLVLRRLPHVALCLYLPFVWLVLMDYPWNDYHVYWLRFWPILPGIIPGMYFFHPHDALEFATMGAVTFGLLAFLTWLATRGRYGLLAATALALIVAVPTSSIAYAIFCA